MKLTAFNKALRLFGGLLPPKVTLAMKITTFILMIALVQASGKGYSQISLNEKNTPLENILKSIKRQTGYSFFYDTRDVKNAKVDIQVNNATLDQVLSICFKDLPLTFTVIQNNVVLKEKHESLLSKISGMISQPFFIHGTVTDENGPLAGVTVAIKGSSRVTSTNDKGEFSLEANENDVLVFTSVGYKTHEVIVKNNRDFKIMLEQNIAGLDQVVVIGYGSTTKKDLTGSVSSVSGKSIEDIPFTTVDNALAGKAAGVEVTKADGTPGGAVKIRIRGSSSLLGGNDPLYVIDGVPLAVQSNYIDPGFDMVSVVGAGLANINAGLASAGNSGLSSAFVNGLNNLGGLNPDDIESIDILKDASSTAIYGSKAANGVVIITTKKGKKDAKPQITASTYTTFSTPITPHVLDAAQYKSLLIEAAQNTSASYKSNGISIPASVAATLNAILGAPATFFGPANTDWIKTVTRNTVSTNEEIAVQGGGNASRYFTSISYQDMPGVVKSTDYQRISGKINLENEISSKFRFGTNILLGYTNQGIGDGAYTQALTARPDFPMYNAQGNFTVFPGVSRTHQNPGALLTAVNNAKTFSLLGSISATYDITKDLQFKSTTSLNMQTYNQRNYLPSYLNLSNSAIDNSSGIGSNSNSTLANWFEENTFTYKKVFKKSTLTALAGTSYETDKTSFFSATATGYPNNSVLTSLSSAATPLIVRGDQPASPQSYLLSFYLRANYSYLDKYLFTITGRSDASSKFGTNNKVGYFPSGAVAWRISQENFLKDVKWIDDIKLRGSYGLTGTQNIGDQMYRTLYNPVSYNGSSAVIPVQLGNNAIKWESTREADGGLDISLFNSRLQVTADYYNKQTSGDLLSLPIPLSSSFGSLLSNSVGIKNTGVELAIQGDIIRTSKFKWSGGLNITWANTLVTKLDPGANLTQIGSFTGLEVGNTTIVQGQPLGLIVGEHVSGILRTQAQVDAYKSALGPNAAFFPTLGIGDANVDLQYNFPASNLIIAHAAPKYYGGFNQSFTYKNFSLQLNFSFSEGGHLVWGDHITISGYNAVTNQNVAILDRYSPTNTNSDEPRVAFGRQPMTQSNLDIYSSSYVKLRSLSFNYQFDQANWIKRAGIKNLSVFASATNVFTITKYPGVDPETSDDTFSSVGGYTDVSNYPAVRTFSIGLKGAF